MSLTAAIWIAIFLACAGAAMVRPAYGIGLYILTYYAFPANWWWGKGFLSALTMRWNLIAALIFLVAIMAQSREHQFKFEGAARKVLTILILYAINATLIHFLVSSNADRSFNSLQLLYKQIGLFILIYLSIRRPSDLKIFIYAVILGALYIAIEIVVNHRGKFRQSRLEGIMIPGAQESNYLAGLLALSIPLAAGLLLVGRGKDRLVGFLATPLIFEVILRCNSRGCYLALLAGGGRLLLACTGKLQKYAVIGVCLTVLAIALQAKNPQIAERFYSTFVSADQRDMSAASRVEFWKSAVAMIIDYPYGSGGEAAFKSERGAKYIHQLYENSPGHQRAVHNGYLDITAAWGLQGIVLYLSAIFLSWQALYRAIVFNRRNNRTQIAFIGSCIESALIVQLVAAVFMSSLDGEWFFWIIGISLAYAAMYGDTAAAQCSTAQGAIARTNLLPDDNRYVFSDS